MSVTRASKQPRRVRSDGERSRRTILDAAARLATVEGLDGITIGGLADAIGMSKSGLYAHFGSKEELQLAVVDTAERVFQEEVVARGMTAPPGRDRALALADGFLDHVERETFPGGCFFASAAAELDTRPGPVRDRIAAVYRDWSALITGSIAEAQRLGQLDAALDPQQLAFEVVALLGGANNVYVLHGDRGVFERARRGIRARLGA